MGMLKPRWRIWIKRSSSTRAIAWMAGSAEVTSRDGSDYIVADVVERWELDDELLEMYARPPDDPSYRD